ncbi:MAG: hypothetical protein PHU01_10160 [Desulfuromonadaceae bacterium]|nr:hypothetical protein [Desulfuromonadaceae bacterium]
MDKMSLPLCCPAEMTENGIRLPGSYKARWHGKINAIGAHG